MEQISAGSTISRSLLTTAPTAHSMVERISQQFELGGHKATVIAMPYGGATLPYSESTKVIFGGK